MSEEKKLIPTWVYTDGGAEILDLAEGEVLPEGFYDHPAKVPGSEAERKHREDAIREGVIDPEESVSDDAD